MQVLHAKNVHYNTIMQASWENKSEVKLIQTLQR